MSTNTLPTTPNVWIGCLACYNAGKLVGDWVEADNAADYVPCTRIEFGSPHEEWWVMDHENFDGLLTGECSPHEAQQLAELHNQLIDAAIPLEAFVAWCDNSGDTYTEGADRIDDFRDAYRGHHGSKGDWAHSFLDDTGMLDQLPEWAKSHTDALVESWLESARNGGEFWAEEAADGGVHIFTN